ncbi:MAG TPA: hypothetical protein VFQ35_24890 [Polyangiaceae bacterium]|nr:hypothetical protein [Polyangiaceae bacterium]
MQTQLIAALLALSFGSACASTSGRAWVRAPEDANLETDVASVDLAPLPAGASSELSDSKSSDETGDVPRPRLAHVISLGESEAAPRSAQPSGAPLTSATPGVVVNIVNYGSSAYAGGYGYPLSYRTATSGAPVVHSSPTVGTPSLGGDWRPAPSYGPSFPWHTGPAPAWERSR